jgi:hypothetical protein
MTVCSFREMALKNRYAALVHPCESLKGDGYNHAELGISRLQEKQALKPGKHSGNIVSLECRTFETPTLSCTAVTAQPLM